MYTFNPKLISKNILKVVDFDIDKDQYFYIENNQFNYLNEIDKYTILLFIQKLTNNLFIYKIIYLQTIDKLLVLIHQNYNIFPIYIGQVDNYFSLFPKYKIDMNKDYIYIDYNYVNQQINKLSLADFKDKIFEFIFKIEKY